MIEIKYKANYEDADIAGRSIAEARSRYKEEFNIGNKAAAFLNGRKITTAVESATILTDEDRLEFKAAGSHRMAYLAGALILAMAITGGVFAYGFTNASATISVTPGSSNFAEVTANASSPVAWTVRGMQKGATGAGTLFDISTLESGYNGDLVASVSLANANDLVKVYRNLSLNIEIRDSANNIIDIDGDGDGDNDDCTLLTLNNASISLGFKQTTAGIYTIQVKSGTFTCHPGNSAWTTEAGAPMLYCEIAQR